MDSERQRESNRCDTWHTACRRLTLAQRLLFVLEQHPREEEGGGGGGWREEERRREGGR